MTGEEDTPQRAALVACGSQKQDLEDGETVPVQELYTSNYFAGKWKWSLTFCDRRFILSAKHGLVPENDEVGHYDQTLGHMTAAEVEAWSERVGDRLRELEHRPRIDEVVVLGGRDYIEPLTEAFEDLADAGIPVYDPFGDTAGIGEQIGWCWTQMERREPGLGEPRWGPWEPPEGQQTTLDGGEA